MWWVTWKSLRVDDTGTAGVDAMRGGRYSRFLSAVLDRRRVVLMVWGLLIVAVMAGLPYPRIFIELDTMLPEDSEITRSIRQAETSFGPSDYIVIGVINEQGLALDRRGILQLQRIRDDLLTLPGVRAEGITSLVSAGARIAKSSADDVQFVPIVGEEENWEGAQKRASESPIFHSLLSSDGKGSLLLLQVDEPEGGKTAFDRSLRQRLAAVTEPGFSVVVGGQPTVFAALERYTQHIFYVLPFTLVLIGLIHFEAFRSIQGLVVPLLTALTSAGVATAVMNLAGIRLDGFNTSAPLLIIALTAGHAVQMLKRYNEEFARLATGVSPGEDEWRLAHRAAIERSFTEIAPVMVAASLVSACSFASLMVFETPVIRTFGFYAAIGILTGLAVELVLIPALRLQLIPKYLPLVESRVTFWDRVVDRCAGVCIRERRWRTVVISTLLISVAAVIGSRVTIDNSVEEYFARFTEMRKTERVLNERFAGSSVFYVVLVAKTENGVATAETANLIASMQDWLIARPRIGAAVSYVDAAAEVGCGFDSSFCGIGPRPWSDDALRQFLYIYESGAGADTLDDVVTPRRDVALIRVLSTTDSSQFVDQLFSDFRQNFGSAVPQGIEMLLGGTGATTLALNQKFIEEKLANVMQMLAIASLIAGLLFRSVSVGLLVAIPLFASTMFAFAVMTVLGIPLNVATVFIAAIAVGIGADYAIYFGTRLRDLLRQHPLDENRAVHLAFRSAGKAALFVACAVGGGYLALISSIGYNVHLWLGLLVSSSMVASIAASLTLFPSLLLIIRPRAIFGGRV